MSKPTRLARLKVARYHATAACNALAKLSLDVNAEEQLAVAVKALRSIANRDSSDDMSKGLARAALKRLRLL